MTEPFLTISLRDSEAQMLIAWHAQEAARLAFRKDYGPEFHDHMDRQAAWAEWIQRSLRARETEAGKPHKEKRIPDEYDF